MYKVAIEINKDNFKLGCIDRVKGAAKIKALVKKEFSPSATVAETGALIKQVVSGLKLKIDSVFCVLPQHKATARMIKLPSVIDGELKGMIDIQTVRLIPYPKEEIIYDYQVVAEEKNEYSWVKVGIAHRNVVNKVLDIIKTSGLFVDGLYLSADASTHWFTEISGIKDEVICLVNVDKAFLDVGITYHGFSIFSRSISFENIRFEPQIICEEIKKTLAGFKKEELFSQDSSKFDIKRIMLAGNKEIAEQIKTDLIKDPSLIVDVLGLGALKGVSDNLKGVYAKDSFCDVLGVLFCERKMINFIPSEIRNKTLSTIKQKHFLYMGILLAGILLVSSGIIFKNIYDQISQVAYLKKQIAKEEAPAKEISLAKSRLDVIKEWYAGQKNFIDILKELYRITPDEISLTVLNYDIDNPLILQGSANMISDIFKYVSILEQSGYFQNVQIKYATKRRVRNRELTDFQINCPFEANKK